MRGPLVHRLEVDGAGRIAAFASVAPTEWMLHPAGPFAAALAALPVDEFTAAAAHVVAAFDPCAPVEPRTAEAADA
jgi:Ni,Fe-hydrogenase I large subunit